MNEQEIIKMRGELVSRLPECTVKVSYEEAANNFAVAVAHRRAPNFWYTSGINAGLLRFRREAIMADLIADIKAGLEL